MKNIKNFKNGTTVFQTPDTKLQGRQKSYTQSHFNGKLLDATVLETILIKKWAGYLIHNEVTVNPLR
jgi:hypothetical protein